MKVFLDTNIFLYAFLDQDVAKKNVAVEIISRTAHDGSGYVSLQVVKEFCNVMLKRSRKSAEDVAEALEIFRCFHVDSDSLSGVRSAISLHGRFSLQFYDALMLSSAQALGCDTILTEDLADGQVYGSVKAVNPFK